MRQSLWRSPGSEPAAPTTTSRGALAAFTAPMTALCAGGVRSSAYSFVTSASTHSAAASASSPARASHTRGRPLSLNASTLATFTLMKRTLAPSNSVFDAVVKSVHRVPTPMTRSASRPMRFAADVPVAPIAPSESGWSYGRDPLPACVSATGMPLRSAKSRSAVVAPL